MQEEYNEGIYIIGEDLELATYTLIPITDDGGEFQLYNSYDDFVNQNDFLNEFFEREYHLPLRKIGTVIRVWNVKFKKKI